MLPSSTFSFSRTCFLLPHSRLLLQFWLLFFSQAFEELEELLARHNICIAIKEKLVKDSGVAEDIAYDNIVQKLLTKPRARGKSNVNFRPYRNNCECQLKCNSQRKCQKKAFRKCERKSAFLPTPFSFLPKTSQINAAVGRELRQLFLIFFLAGLCHGNCAN